MSAPSTAATDDTTKDTSSSTGDGDVMLLPSPRLNVLSFAVSVPASSTMDPISFDDDYDDTVGAAMSELGISSSSKKKKKPPMTQNASAMDGIGMVGTIILLKTSVIVWFGWGATSKTPTQDSTNGREGVNHSRILGSLPQEQHAMGHLLVAMPPRKFGGASSEPQSSTSKLIGGEYPDDETVAQQMARRLSQKSKMPVLVSCQLDPTHAQSMGFDPDLLHARAAALAEQHIWSILQKQKQQQGIPK
ncbi:expressed unknown protein [Seminavis robusta]|uniref:Uncharacterized protein n=1 Tax=Seminavis robusta TaxID=568900 RepID=A0A9N8EJL3_9STRA|nr:expressed unknown protein [Seminavis robusta]|eukprot:Sro1104_g241860.1 n/a (247) ;mRNA; f:31176-31916